MQSELLVRSAILVQISPLVQMSLKRPISPIVQSAILVQNTRLAAPGALAHRPHHLKNQKRPPGGPKMADGVWKGV